MFEETGLCCTAVHSPGYLQVGFCQVGLCEFRGLWEGPQLGPSLVCVQGGYIWSRWLVCATNGHASTNRNGPECQKKESHMLPSKAED